MVRSVGIVGSMCGALLALTTIAATPAMARDVELASMVVGTSVEPIQFPAIAIEPEIATPRASDTELECLAVAVYHEARGEPRIGQLAVAQVVVNRARSGRFARTLCGVIAQPGQFPFVRQAAHRRNPSQWQRALDVARRVAAGEVASVVGGALYFHAARISPGWRRARVAAIGNHIFYR